MVVTLNSPDVAEIRHSTSSIDSMQKEDQKLKDNIVFLDNVHKHVYIYILFSHWFQVCGPKVDCAILSRISCLHNHHFLMPTNYLRKVYPDIESLCLSWKHEGPTLILQNFMVYRTLVLVLLLKPITGLCRILYIIYGWLIDWSLRTTLQNQQDGRFADI